MTTIAKDARSSPRPRTPTASTPQPTSPRFEGSISTDSILFIGSSSPFSFISHKGVEWINSRLGNEHFSELIRRAEGEYQQLLQDQEEVPRGEYSETPELRELYINGKSGFHGSYLLISTNCTNPADDRILPPHSPHNPPLLHPALPPRRHLHPPLPRRATPIT